MPCFICSLMDGRSLSLRHWAAVMRPSPIGQTKVYFFNHSSGVIIVSLPFVP